MSEQDLITELTRRRLFDYLNAEKVVWHGRLGEIAFLERLYPLDELPSEDSRFTTARRDIQQHRFNNDDWDDDWVYEDSRFGLVAGPPQVLLAFLAAVLHPVVRRDPEEVQRLLKGFNQILWHDGFELAEVSSVSGSPVFAGRQRVSFHGGSRELDLYRRPLLTDPTVLHEHLNRIRAGIAHDPAAAIGSSKELLESLPKIILSRSAVSYAPGDDVLSLYKKAADLLGLNADAIPGSVKGSDAVKKILRTLTTTVQSLAEMRNALGLGHGRTTSSPALTRHARLALNSTVAITEFLLDTWQDRVDRGTVMLAPGPGTL